MGKKAKTGKARRDKAYWSAKEIGYRSRASFKLVQLNRKYEFLQKSRVCIDLCAAPGSWMQVAKENMPMSSLIIGVDLVPIKPIPGCIALQDDITTDKCRTDLKKELQTWKADLVLHDGAPNVGKSWIHDAYQQSLITLSAFKLATEFLIKNGTFVTKVFRSKDYQSLIWVFNQFFKSVNATKPAASRNESAEIFVVCQGYKAPDKIDPKFLDAKHVFSEVDGTNDESSKIDNELINPERKKKSAADGYEEGATLLFKVAKASDFILGDKPIHVLNNCHEIQLDEERIRKHKKTTTEIVECCKDIKVLGIKELRLLKKWRELLRCDFESQTEKVKEKEAMNSESEKLEENHDGDGSEDEDLKKLEDEIYMLKDEERRGERRAKKKALKEKRKAADRIDLKMVIPGDKGPTLHEEGLFKLSNIQSTSEMNSIMDQAPETLEHDSDDEVSPKKPKKEKYSKENGKLDKSGLFYTENSGESDNESSNTDESDDGEDLGLGEELESDDMDDTAIESLNDPSQNKLIVDMEDGNRVTRKEKRANMWFDKDIFKGIEDDEDLEEADVEMAINVIKNKGGQIKEKKPPSDKTSQKESTKKSAKKTQKMIDSAKTDLKNGHHDGDSDSSSSDSDSDDSDFDENEHYPYRKQQKVEKEGFEEVPITSANKIKKRPMLTPEELALGQQLVSSKKTRRELEDAAWNRYMFDDRDKDLPDWFVREEQYHMRKLPEVDPEAVEYYRNKQKDINVKTIKKVVEAKARKKRLLMKKMSKAKKRAASIMENEDLGSREKAKEIERLYKKAKQTKKREVVYSVAKKFVAAKKAKRPAGVKGLYKQVDPRMKKDTNTKRGNATSTKVQKRRLKGKKTRPQ